MGPLTPVCIFIYKYFYANVKRNLKFPSGLGISLWNMGRRPTTPKGASSVSAKLPPSLQIGVHQLILDKWKKTGRKPSQNELLIDALREYLKNRSIDVSQIEQAVEKWPPKENKRASVTRFTNRRKEG
jgi:hypothetical protein